MRHLALLLIIISLSGCAMISKQFYYVPSVPHQTIKSRNHRSDLKMIYSRVKISNRADDSIGSITTSNGTGHPLLMGPFVPVFPVGGFFQKISGRFAMDVSINCNTGYFMPLAIDSGGYKRVRDSLNALKIGTIARLNTQTCYLLVNDTLKVPVEVKEYIMGSTTGHSYLLSANIRFRKVNTMRLITGNAVLDSTLKNINFKRKSRIKFDLIGPGY